MADKQKTPPTIQNGRHSKVAVTSMKDQPSAFKLAEKKNPPPTIQNGRHSKVAATTPVTVNTQLSEMTEKHKQHSTIQGGQHSKALTLEKQTRENGNEALGNKFELLIFLKNPIFLDVFWD